MDPLAVIQGQIAAQPMFWLVLVFSYLLGSIPFGLVITRVFLGFDVRSQGSGNIGMTNVMRTAGKWPGIATFLLDFFKGLVAVTLPVILGFPLVLVSICGVVVVLGHTRSVFLRFQGGKGVATNFGVWAGLDWRIFVGSAALWLVVFLFKKISSLSALASLFAMPLLAYLFWQYATLFWTATLLSLYIIALHRANILRLLKGEEGKLKAKEEG